MDLHKAAPNRKSSYRPTASSAGVRAQNSDDPPLPESFPENFRACGADHSQIHNHKITSDHYNHTVCHECHVVDVNTIDVDHASTVMVRTPTSSLAPVLPQMHNGTMIVLQSSNI